MIVFSAIVPHPLESIPGIGQPSDRKKIKKTLASFKALRIALEKAAPDTVIIISPHAKMERYSFVINSAKKLVGDFSQFGVAEKYSYENDKAILNKIAYTCKEDELSFRLRRNPLDYGALIPLQHLLQNIQPKVVHLAFSLMNYQQHFRYGQLLESVIGAHQSKRIAIIASAELSHRLTPNAPAGFSPEAEKFDREIVHHLGENNLLSIMSMHREVIDKVAECGLRSIIILMGALHEEKYAFKLLSYEGPSGIGYLMARLI
jgi:MEMO1 family protein